MKQTGWTTISQGSKLVELGLDPETADMTWVNDLNGDHIIAKPYQVLHKELDELRADGEIESVESPAWSVGSLIDLMPQHITSEGRWMKFGIDKGWDGVTYQVYYETQYSFIDKKDKELVNALYNMMVYLLKKNFIKKGE